MAANTYNRDIFPFQLVERINMILCGTQKVRVQGQSFHCYQPVTYVNCLSNIYLHNQLIWP